MDVTLHTLPNVDASQTGCKFLERQRPETDLPNRFGGETQLKGAKDPHILTLTPTENRIQSPQACLPLGSNEKAVKWPAWPQGPSQIHSRGRRKGEGNPQG